MSVQRIVASYSLDRNVAEWQGFNSEGEQIRSGRAPCEAELNLRPQANKVRCCLEENELEILPIIDSIPHRFVFVVLHTFRIKLCSQPESPQLKRARFSKSHFCWKGKKRHEENKGLLRPVLRFRVNLSSALKNHLASERSEENKLPTEEKDIFCRQEKKFCP